MKIKQRLLAVLCGAALLVLTAAGCSQPSSQAEYIGLDAAKAIALEAAGVAESAAVFTTTGLDRQNGTDFYAIDFTANGQSYEYDIDAITGIIIGRPQENPAASASSQPDPSADPSTAASADPIPVPSSTSGQSASGSITETQARQIALDHAGLTTSQVTFLKSSLTYENGRQVYDVEFYSSDYTEYDYEIDAATGDILSYDFDAEGYAPPTANTTTITADQARQIALAKVPGATVNDIYEFELDRDDGRLEYEGTIYYNGMEYEFTIDGYSGAIRSWDVESYYD